jgi:hypothetical protein
MAYLLDEGDRVAFAASQRLQSDNCNTNNWDQNSALEKDHSLIFPVVGERMRRG